MDALVLDAVLARPLDVSAVAAGNAAIAGTVLYTVQQVAGAAGNAAIAGTVQCTAGCWCCTV